MKEIRVKRVYDPPSHEDGDRILVDRIWPRGLSKEKAHVALWLKEVAPSTPLRQWFGHEPSRWKEFQRRYSAELKAHADAVDEVRAHSEHGTVTLLYSARDTEHNNAVALRDYLRSHH